MDCEANVRRFSAALDAYPAGFSGNRLNLLLLEDAQPVSVADTYFQQIDDISLLEERREYLLDERSPWPFPRICLDDRPDPWTVSQQLFEHFEQAQRLVPCQQQIGNILEKRVRQTDPAVVVLVIVDGLSYYDLPEKLDAEPCLVAGVSTTEYGYRAVVGKPAVSRRMFALGYTDQMGFTYFPVERDDLSADIHDTFSTSQVIRVKAFEEILDWIQGRSRLGRGYLQITLSGLDQLSHAHRDRPPRDHYLEEVLTRFEVLFDSLKAKCKHVLVCLTADHGILWRDVIGDRIRIAHDLFQDEIYHPRYVKGSVLRPYGRCCRSLGQNFTLLNVPWMTRKFKNNEWGVHGGISAWESIVPLLIRES